MVPPSRINKGGKGKSAYNSLIIDTRGLRGETNLQIISGWKYFDVFRFNLRPLLQDHMGMTKLENGYIVLLSIAPGMYTR